MAGWELLGSEATVQVLSPEIVKDAQRVVARALKSGVVFSLLVVNDIREIEHIVPLADRVNLALDTWAQFWDMNAAEPGVVNISMSQEVDSAGQLKDVALVTVESASGRSSNTVTLFPNKFLPTDFRPAVKAVRDNLEITEAAGPPVDESGVTPFGVVVDSGL